MKYQLVSPVNIKSNSVMTSNRVLYLTCACCARVSDTLRFSISHLPYGYARHRTAFKVCLVVDTSPPTEQRDIILMNSAINHDDIITSRVVLNLRGTGRGRLSCRSFWFVRIFRPWMFKCRLVKQMGSTPTPGYSEGSSFRQLHFQGSCSGGDA